MSKLCHAFLAGTIPSLRTVMSFATYVGGLKAWAWLRLCSWLVSQNLTLKSDNRSGHARHARSDLRGSSRAASPLWRRGAETVAYHSRVAQVLIRLQSLSDACRPDILH